MNQSVIRTLSIIAIVLGVFAGTASAQNEAAPETATAPSTGTGFDTLVGQWVRPDGGYRITIRGVDAAGKLDASYANPSPLPFAKAEASLEGDAIQVFLELRAGGYNGSTYNLTYEAATDRLRGVYYQAVAQQKYQVYFERIKPPQ